MRREPLPGSGDYQMNALLLTVALLLPAQETPKPVEQPGGAPAAKSQSLDGNWTVVCYEKNGLPMTEAKDCTVMIKDNLVTFQPKNDKTKMMAIRLELGQNGTIRATETAQVGTDSKPEDKDNPAKTGVIVRTQEYVAICVHDAGADKGKGGEEKTTNDKPGQATEAKSYCTVILKRSGGTEERK